MHPESHKPLTFFGSVKDGDGIPVYVVSQDQLFPEEVLEGLEENQGEKWIEKRWADGFLWAFGENDMYPVVDGIPIFVLPPRQTWTPLSIMKLRKEKWIERNWKKAGESIAHDKSQLTEFAKRMAESDGLILDVASGPGGGFVPRVLHMNPEAKILIDDTGLGLLQEWQRFLNTRRVSKVSFALFDATIMPLKSNSIDMVSDLGGFDSVVGGERGIKEAYRVLKPGGTLLSMNGMTERDDFLQLPEKVRKKWYNWNPSFFDGFLEAFKKVGFKINANTFLKEKELKPEEGDLPRVANEYGVKLRVRHYCTEATK